MLFHISSLLINLCISCLGLLVVILLVFSPSSSHSILWQKQIISLIFASLCFFGAIAVFLPNKCSKIAFGDIQNKDEIINLSSERFSSIIGIKLIHGHHPSLKSFSQHEYRIRNKSICAGCFGLFIGAILSIVGIIAYNLLNIDFSIFAQSLVGLGVVAVALSVFSPIFYSSSSVIRILLNTSFILGMLFILVGIDSLISRLEINLFLVGLFVFWMMTRIFVSKHNHEKIYVIE